MNKVIWKGIDSSEIKGLMICELPPITKPGMRIKEEVIDGVDGSTYEELGYESYDKQLLIALTNDFDINEVIKYFTGEGNVVFSNEPDKYYRGRIIEQVDYERLLRYRTATVKFKIQPYKYEFNENVVVLTKSGTTVKNKGLETSKPKLTINGTGTIEFILNDNKIFSYTFPDGENSVVIDSEKQDAYLGNILKNRNMIGEFPIFQVGDNTVAWTGTVSNIEISSYSRWL